MLISPFAFVAFKEQGSPTMSRASLRKLLLALTRRKNKRRILEGILLMACRVKDIVLLMLVLLSHYHSGKKISLWQLL